MHSRINTITFTSHKDANEVVDQLFDSLRSRYQENLETSIGGSDFIFDSVQLVYCNCHKVSFRHSSSYIDSADCIKKKKSNNISKKRRSLIFSICGNGCNKLWRN